MNEDNINELKVQGIAYLCNCYYKSKIHLDNEGDLIDVINELCYTNNEKDIKDKISKFITDQNNILKQRTS